jgi:hypothetical protein
MRLLFVYNQDSFDSDDKAHHNGKLVKIVSADYQEPSDKYFFVREIRDTGAVFVAYPHELTPVVASYEKGRDD